MDCRKFTLQLVPNLNLPTISVIGVGHPSYCSRTFGHIIAGSVFGYFITSGQISCFVIILRSLSIDLSKFPA